MASFDTDFPGDCFEFCPNEQHQDIFVCGTYKLLDQASTSTSESDPNTNLENASAPQKRIGQCLAFRLAPSPSDGLALYVAFLRVLCCADLFLDQRENPRARPTRNPGHEVEVVRRLTLICPPTATSHRLRLPGAPIRAARSRPRSPSPTRRGASRSTSGARSAPAARRRSSFRNVL